MSPTSEVVYWGCVCSVLGLCMLCTGVVYVVYVCLFTVVVDGVDQ